MFLRFVLLTRMARSVSRGIELVAIRMSHTSGVNAAVSSPSTLHQVGVISVMPWTTLSIPLSLIIVTVRRPKLSNGVIFRI